MEPIRRGGRDRYAPLKAITGLEDISNTQRIWRVFKGGLMIGRELLDLPGNRR